MQHVAQDSICHVFSFLSYHSIPTISLICHDWNEALGNERRECWRLWFHERVNEARSTCKRSLSKRLQKMTESKNRSERLLFMGFVQHQNVESLRMRSSSVSGNNFYHYYAKTLMPPSVSFAHILESVSSL
jgi:hypothetical protein